MATNQAEILDRLEWYDMTLRQVSNGLGFLRVLTSKLWRAEDPSARNHGVPSLYYAPLRLLPASCSRATVWNLAGIDQGPWPSLACTLRERIEGAAEEVANEYDNILHASRVHPDASRLVPSGAWLAAPLFDVGGCMNEEICALCPRTTHLLRSLPLCRPFGFAMFSTLKPGTRIAAHRGSCNMRLRCHLTLRNPDGQRVAIRVGSERAYWEEGRCLAFDDSYEHEVIHQGVGERVVLAFDLWHPSLSDEEVTILSHPILQTFGRLNQPSLRSSM
jgi:aspartate beta-hydroxylase